MPRLTDIASEIAGLLSAINVDNGFSFDFGTVNEPDTALCVLPCANITYLTDTPESDTASAYGYDVAQFEIKIIADLAAFPSIPPTHAIDVVYDTILDAVKRKIRSQQGFLPLSGNAYMVYKGSKKTVEKSGDVFSPDSVVVKVEVHYQSTEQTPVAGQEGE